MRHVFEGLDWVPSRITIRCCVSFVAVGKCTWNTVFDLIESNDNHCNVRDNIV